MNDVYQGIPIRDRIRLRLQDAYLSVKNVDSVYSSICKVMADKHGCRLAPSQYRRETHVTMERVFSIKAPELTDNHLQNPKETIYMLDAMAIERVVATMVEIFHAQRNRPVMSSPDVFDRPKKKPKKSQLGQLAMQSHRGPLWKALGPNGRLPPLLPVPSLAANRHMPYVAPVPTGPLGPSLSLPIPFLPAQFPTVPQTQVYPPQPPQRAPEQRCQIAVNAYSASTHGSRGMEYDFGATPLLKILLVDAQVAFKRPPTKPRTCTFAISIKGETFSADYVPTDDIQGSCEALEKALREKTGSTYTVRADSNNKRVTLEGPEVFSLLLASDKDSSSYFGFKQRDHTGQQVYAGAFPAGSLPSGDVQSIHLVTSVTHGPVAPIPVVERGGTMGTMGRASRTFNNLKFWYSDLPTPIGVVQFSFEDDDHRPVEIDPSETSLTFQVVVGSIAQRTFAQWPQSNSGAYQQEPMIEPNVEGYTYQQEPKVDEGYTYQQEPKVDEGYQQEPIVDEGHQQESRIEYAERPLVSGSYKQAQVSREPRVDEPAKQSDKPAWIHDYIDQIDKIAPIAL